jgi:hypothetical protein
MIPMKINDIVRIKIGNNNGRSGLTNGSITVKTVSLDPLDLNGFTFQARATNPNLDQSLWFFKPDEILPNMPSKPRKGKYIGEPVFQP